MSSAFGSLVWFVVILMMIPVALWVLKRTPMGGAGVGSTLMRAVTVLQLSQSQRIVTIEVGQGEDRKWLVLGVTPQSITTLHTMAPQAEAEIAPVTAGPAFAQIMAKLRKPKGPGES